MALVGGTWGQTKSIQRELQQLRLNNGYSYRFKFN